MREVSRIGFGALALVWFAGCAAPATSPSEARDAGEPTGVTPKTASETSDAGDRELESCRARIVSLEAEPALPGAPGYDEHRPEFLGRARGEPVVFVREPEATADEALSPAALASRRAVAPKPPGSRVLALRARHKADPEGLRALVLREGYAFAPDPLDALALAAHVTLPDLFREPRIVLQRRAETRWLRRETKRGETTYRYEDGPLEGRAADLLFGDRVAVDERELEHPLHRDVRSLAETAGFDRARIERRTEKGLIASLRFGDRWARAAIDADGARLSLACLAEDRATRDAIATARSTTAARRRALHALQETVTEVVQEAFRFDRPEGEKSPDRDGQLRPFWASAYFQGRRDFEFEGTTLPVYDPSGNAWPPEVCVDFVLDSFERTSGTWFHPLGEHPQRDKGRLDFNETGIANRRGVIAFGDFAEAHPELFEVIRFHGGERVPFRDRSRFFDELTDRADDVRAGDVVAIQGVKADGRIHQHAILVEWTDPVTGFAAGLADQMRRPRRRTWEGIMAEAPLRSLFYRARPSAAVFAKIDPGQ
jgi:hypothetical protein